MTIRLFALIISLYVLSGLITIELYQEVFNDWGETKHKVTMFFFSPIVLPILMLIFLIDFLKLVFSSLFDLLKDLYKKTKKKF